MKIAYIVKGDPYDKHSWSGTNYYVRDSLAKQGCDIYCIYGFKPQMTILDIIYKIWAKLLGKHYNEERTRNYTRQWAQYVSANLQEGTDAILSLGTLMVADLKTNIPIYIYVDGIFEQMRIFYGGKALLKKNIQDGNLIEQKALNNCRKIISCSIETAGKIRRYYDVIDSKIEIIPLGANLDESPQYEVVLDSIEHRSNSTCKLLFVGVDWYRKGADIVLETAKILHERGLNIELYLCGLKKIPVDLPDYVINWGFLRKTNIKEYSELRKLYLDSHFLFVPSRAEAYGLVFCEASAHGLPSISFRQGGLTTIVKDGVNGQLFELESSPEDFAEYIINMFNNRKDYISLSQSSVKRYHDRLNWEVAGRCLVDTMKS